MWVNEAFHYALQTIFWAFLENLDGRIVALQDYLDEFRNYILEESITNSNLSQDNSLQDILTLTDDLNLPEKLRELVQLSKSYMNWKKAASKAFNLFLIIHQVTKPYSDKIQYFEGNNGIDVQNGRITEHLNLYINNNLALNYSKYIEKSLRKLLNDHIATAYRKMGNGETSLLKFIIEDNVITHVQTMEPRFTTPRIKTIHNFLCDLKFLDNKGSSLTDEGKNLLMSLR